MFVRASGKATRPNETNIPAPKSVSFCLLWMLGVCAQSLSRDTNGSLQVWEPVWLPANTKYRILAIPLLCTSTLRFLRKNVHNWIGHHERVAFQTLEDDTRVLFRTFGFGTVCLFESGRFHDFALDGKGLTDGTLVLLYNIAVSLDWNKHDVVSYRLACFVAHVPIWTFFRSFARHWHLTLFGMKSKKKLKSFKSKCQNDVIATTNIEIQWKIQPWSAKHKNGFTSFKKGTDMEASAAGVLDETIEPLITTVPTVEPMKRGWKWNRVQRLAGFVVCFPSLGFDYRCKKSHHDGMTPWPHRTLSKHHVILKYMIFCASLIPERELWSTLLRT